MESVTVKIKGGKVEISTKGFAGTACQKATEGLSKALGRSVKDTPTDEMFQQSVDDQTTLGR